MNNKLSLIFIILSIILIVFLGIHFFTKNVYYGAGGIGNLKMYEFNISTEKLKFAVNETFRKHPELKMPNDAIYKNDDFSTVCFIKYKDDEYALGFNYYTDDTTFLKENPEKSILVLVHGNYYGKVLLRDGELPESDKTIMTQAFEEKFISKLNVEVDSISSISNN